MKLLLVILAIVLVQNAEGSYFLFSAAVTFQEAVHECSSINAKVVSIDDSNEDALIFEKYLQDSKVTSGIWLAIYDYIGNETNVNYYTNTTLNYTNWVSGQPHTKSDHCVRYEKTSSKKWDETTCTKHFSVLCETNITPITNETTTKTSTHFSTVLSNSTQHSSSTPLTILNNTVFQTRSDILTSPIYSFTSQKEDTSASD
jgi:hypothetical protein